MRSGSPKTALEAVTSRRLLAGGWPWRSAAFLLTTVPVALAVVAVLGIPWLVLVARLASGEHRPGTIVALVLLGSALIAALGPLVTVPLVRLERWRLRLVDGRPVGAVRRRQGFRARYTAPATWREVGYACLLAGVAPVLSGAALLAVPLIGGLVAGPVLVAAQGPGDAPVALVFAQVATVKQAIPYAVGGVLLLPLVPYLLTLLAGGHAAVARRLLFGEPGLRAELVEVSRSRARLVDAFEAERRRIERDLHDGAQQRLVSLTLQLGLARLDLPPGSPAAETVATAHQHAKQLMAELRELIHGIQPQILTDLGLPAALGELADQAPLRVTVETRLPGRLPFQIENTAYFVAAEALTNVAKHSGATRASVTAHRLDGVLVIEVSDNGRGGADPDHGSGLTGLADRVAVIGGKMLLSSPPGGPTRLRAELPCP